MPINACFLWFENVIFGQISITGYDLQTTMITKRDCQVDRSVYFSSIRVGIAPLNSIVLGKGLSL